MITPYVCSYCGNERAVWHIKLNTSMLEHCESCVAGAMNRYSHVLSFRLNRRQDAKVHGRAGYRKPIREVMEWVGREP